MQKNKMLNIRRFSGPNSILLFLSGIILLTGCETKPELERPNIVIILADDLGYGDLGCYNSNSLVPTPNLDRLAAEGIRLTRAYCPVAVCSPTRYALMTGRYPWRSRKKSGVMANYEPSMIDSSLLTLPEMLQKAGYTTAGFGKWHLGTSFPTLDGEKPAGFGKFRADNNGANLDLKKPVWDGPVDHGFDRWLGFSCASECWILDDKKITGAIGHDLYTIEAAPNKENIGVIPLADYLSYITEHALQFLDRKAASKDGQPFFLYFSPYVPHVPLAVSEKFRGTTEAGLYGDYVHELDAYIGRLLNKLQELELKENTIVLFASDNGSQFELTSSAIDLSTAGNNRIEYEINPDSFPVHRPNYPLRGTKWSIYEGGVRTPFIARWPGHFPAGQTSDNLLALNDLMATLAAAIEYDSPDKIGEDSQNLLPVLAGEDQNIREGVVVQSSGRLYALVRGKWKYIGVGNYQSPDPDDPSAELYDLSLDVSEQTNLYDRYPEVAGELEKTLVEMLEKDVSLEE